MSHVMEPGICYCSCHEPGSMKMHCAPCCEGPCPVCKRNVARGSDHVERCKARLAELVAETERRNQG